MSWEPIPWLQWDAWHHGGGAVVYPISLSHDFAAGEQALWTAENIPLCNEVYRDGGWANWQFEPTTSNKTIGEFYLAGASTSATGQYSTARVCMGVPSIAGMQIAFWIGAQVRGKPGTWNRGYSVVLTGQVHQPEAGLEMDIAIYRQGPDSTLLGKIASGITAVNWTWWYVKGWASGDTIKGKAWIPGNDEPDWQIEVTDSTYPTGAPGVVLGLDKLAGTASLPSAYTGVLYSCNYEVP